MSLTENHTEITRTNQQLIEEGMRLLEAENTSTIIKEEAKEMVRLAERNQHQLAMHRFLNIQEILKCQT